MRSAISQSCRLLIWTIVLAGCPNAFGQSAGAPADEGMSVGFYFVSFLILGILAGEWFFWKKRSSKAIEVPRSQYNYNISYNRDGYDSYEMDDLDAERDLEWLRNAKMTKGRRDKGVRRQTPTSAPYVATSEGSIDTREFQEKMRKLQYTQLPINSFSQLASAKNYKPLELSDDPSLLTAIEQAGEEFEEDESVRDLAVRILTAFRTRNSVEALSQIALYDLSSSLRSKAVAVLADFDHESVFETLLLACADPTREVRAAAARGLFRLSFDRAHAWKRIIEAGDDFRMRHAARAAIEAGIVVKSFERLVHEDMKIAYEAFALVSLLIKAGETDAIFDAVCGHKDERIKYALLHVLKVHKDPRTLDRLNQLRIGRSWPTDVSDRIRDTVKSCEQEATWSGREL